MLAIREQGGLPLRDGTVLWPEPVLVGRNEAKLREIAERHGLTDWTTDLDAALARRRRRDLLRRAGHHRRGRRRSGRPSRPASTSTPRSRPPRTLRRRARAGPRRRRRRASSTAWCRTSSSCPACASCKRLVDGGFFGRILSVRGEFGYWVFEGDWQAAQRPSWNYRAEDGGGIVVDMFPHWHYVLEQLFAPVARGLPRTSPPTSRSAGTSRASAYEATADDAAYGIFELEGGIVAQINSSWAVRVYRDELVEFQVDGTEGSAVAGLRDCRVQHRGDHPEAGVEPGPAGHRATSAPSGRRCPDNEEFDNGFKAQWEVFLRARRRRRAVHLGPAGPAPAACSSPSWACSRRARAAASRSRS